MADLSKKKSIVELYEYEIFGYSNDLQGEVSYFNEITKVPTHPHPNDNNNNNNHNHNNNNVDHCGLIKVGKYHNGMAFNDKFKSTCDLIESAHFDADDPYPYQQPNNHMFENVYYQTRPKSRDQLTKYYSNHQIINNIHTTTLAGYKIMKSYCKHILPKKTLDTLTQNDALIFNVLISVDEKIIIIGDLHGGFHTFWRHIKRLQYNLILDDAYKLKQNHRIIFLGDVFDRGQHALEIFQIIMKLITENNSPTELKVIYNRGNHESPGLYKSQGNTLKSELEAKQFDQYPFFKLLDKLLVYLPSAIILNCSNGDNIWLSHGGIPINFNNNKSYDPVELNYDPSINSIIVCPNNKSGYPTQIRWNDFVYKQESTYNISRGGGANVPIYNIGTTDLKNFLEANKLIYVIRGHQDFPYNSYIVSSYDKANFDPNNKFTKFDKYGFYRFVIGRVENDNIEDNDFIYINKNKYVGKDLCHSTTPKNSTRQAVFGPIARLALTNNFVTIKLHENPIILCPVLTISTNMDIDRPLMHDSYIQLVFSEDVPAISKYNHVGGFRDMNYNKYIKYKVKYYKMKNNSSLATEIIQ